MTRRQPGVTLSFPFLSIDEAVTRLRAGRLVAFPTETVYGLGGDARNPAAIAAIFAAKGRPTDHPLIVHIPPGADPAWWTPDLSPLAIRLIEAFWPGPLTLVLKRDARVPAAVAGGQDTIALRCPAHPLAQQLLQAFCDSAPAHAGRGLAAPSANRFGHVSPTLAAHVQQEFGGLDIGVIDGGPCDLGIESTILDVSDVERHGGRPVLLRPGSIDRQQIAELLGELPHSPDARAPRVSGSLSAHYAPRTPLTLMSAADLDQVGPGAAVWTHSVPLRHAGWRRAPADAALFARELYAVLRELDDAGPERIVIETPPAGPAWEAVRDRLGRAAAGSGWSGT